MKKKSDRLTWNTVWSYNGRGVKLLYRENRSMFLSITLYSILKALIPMVTIRFMALILSELSGARNPEHLRNLILMILSVETILLILQAVAMRWKNSKGTWDAAYLTNNLLLSKTFLNMDYCMIQDADVQNRLSKQRQDANIGWGIQKLPSIYEQLFEAFVMTISAITLALPGFITRIPDTSPELQFLNHPIWIVLFLIIAGSIIIVAGKCVQNAELLLNGEDSIDDLQFFNRCFFQFGFHALWNRECAAEIRMYAQDHLISEHLKPELSGFNPQASFWKIITGKGRTLTCMSAVLETLLIGIIYVYICIKAWAGAFDIGAASQYIGAATTLFTGFSLLIGVLGKLKTNAVFLQTLFDLVDTPHPMYQGSLSTEKRLDARYEIEFRNVSFKYPGSDTYALRDINLRFRIGERLAVVGENGSGKTTFIKLLCRLYDPTEGVILLNDIDIRKYNYLDYLNLFAVTFQDFQLPSFRLGETVAASSDVDIHRMEAVLDQVGFGPRYRSLKFGADTYLAKDFSVDGQDFSGGEKQKIAMARTLYKDAPMIILDEPTAALDPIAEAEIYQQFHEMTQGKTTVFISHRLASCRFCDEIAVFDHGHIVQKDSHDALLSDTAGKYSELWHAQAQYYE